MPLMTAASPNNDGRMKEDPSKNVDLAIAAVGAGTACFLLCYLENLLGVRLYAPPLAASSVIIFSGIKPPKALQVFAGTFGAALFALLRCSIACL